jgi:hypothetical protein
MMVNYLLLWLPLAAAYDAACEVLALFASLK